MAQSLDPGFETERAVVARLAFVEGRQGQSTRQRSRPSWIGLPGVDGAAFTEGVR